MRETESHLVPCLAKVRGDGGSTVLARTRMLSPGISPPRLGLCKVCVAQKPRFREAHQVQNRRCGAAVVAFTSLLLIAK